MPPSRLGNFDSNSCKCVFTQIVYVYLDTHPEIGPETKIGQHVFSDA